MLQRYKKSFKLPRIQGKKTRKIEFFVGKMYKPQISRIFMQTTRHTALFTLPQITDHSLLPTDNGSLSTLPQITPITQINSANSFPLQDSYLCGSARGYGPQITPITLIKLCGSARETLTADYTDYTDKLCELFSPSRKEPLRLCAGILPTGL